MFNQRLFRMSRFKYSYNNDKKERPGKKQKVLSRPLGWIFVLTSDI